MRVVDENVTPVVTELLQELIRNSCVNDGTEASGQEIRSADLLADYLEGPGLDLERYEPAPGRVSLVARIEGRRGGEAPSLLLMGHTDVVPVNPERWDHDPFGGELIDGEVWGRGAIDMLNLTSSMAVATRGLADEGFRPDGDLVYLAVADEEALGTFGAEHLATHERDAVATDYVITESGGIPIPSPAGPKLPVLVGEKGVHWRRLRVKGTPGHGAQPFRTDTAVVKAAEVVRRIPEYRPEARVHEGFRAFLEGMGHPAEMTAPLLDPDRVVGACEELPPAMGRMFHACTHTTFAPTVLHGGQKTNIIADLADIDLDIRALPGDGADEVDAMIAEALGDLAGDVEVIPVCDDAATTSPTDTPLWDTLSRVTRPVYEDSALVPLISAGATDARFFRRLGITSYGFGLFSTRLSFEDFGTMFHGDNERVDVDSLRLSTQLWEAVANDLLIV